MKKSSEELLMKNRSYNSCIATGYKLYTDNFRKIFKSSLAWGLLYAIAVSVLGTISAIQLPRLTLMTITNATYNIPLYENPEYISLGTSLLAVIIIGGLIEVVFYSSGISLLRQHQDTGNMVMPSNWFAFDINTAWRTIKAAFFYFIISLLFIIPLALLYWYCLSDMLLQPKDHILSLSVVGIGIILLMCLALPFCFTSTKYLLKKNGSFWAMLPKDYSTAFRHYGFILIISLISIIAVVIVSFITSLPTFIISYANYTANLGMLLGDPLGMPNYILALTAGVFFICGFIQAYVRMTFLFPAYYMYGTIETHEEEKKEILQNSKDANLVLN